MKAVVVDTQEKKPVEFPQRKVIRAKLRWGDYALDGKRTYAAVERKGGWDWVSCNLDAKAKGRLNDQLFRLVDNVARPMLLVEVLPEEWWIIKKFPFVRRGYRKRLLEYAALWSEVLPVVYETQRCPGSVIQ
jgi:ERCC4-type nuclease